MNIEMSTSFSKNLNFIESKYQNLIQKDSKSVGILFEPSSQSRLPNRKRLILIVPREHNFAQVMAQLKKDISLEDSQGLFFSVGKMKSLNANMLIGDIYDRYKINDGHYLIVQYSEIESFG